MRASLKLASLVAVLLFTFLPAAAQFNNNQTAAEVALKQNLNDPSSFERIEWIRYSNNLGKSSKGKPMILPDTFAVWELKYRAKNAFGALVISEQQFLFTEKSFLFYRNGVVWLPRIKGDFGKVITEGSAPEDLRTKKW
jgi:hypothetical protein